MSSKFDLQKEIEELEIISIEGSGTLTEKTLKNALEAIREDRSRNSEEKDWEIVKELQKKKTLRMQGGALE